jgi:carbonic anhydrase
MGHGACGGCNAALTRRFHAAEPGQGRFIVDWISLLDGAREEVLANHREGTDINRAMELAAVKVSLANLRTFPFVTEHEKAGKLKLHGAWFAIADGVLHVLNEADGRFAPV